MPVTGQQRPLRFDQRFCFGKLPRLADHREHYVQFAPGGTIQQRAGLHTHRRALDAGCKAVGATVHFVTPELDHGPIVMQSVVPVRPDDTEDTLAARVLVQEHQLYPRAIRLFIEDRLSIDNGVVRIAESTPY